MDIWQWYGERKGELFQDLHPLCTPCSHSLFSIFPGSKEETWTGVYLCVFIIFQTVLRYNPHVIKSPNLVSLYGFSYGYIHHPVKDIENPPQKCPLCDILESITSPGWLLPPKRSSASPQTSFNMSQLASSFPYWYIGQVCFETSPKFSNSEPLT